MSTIAPDTTIAPVPDVAASQRHERGPLVRRLAAAGLLAVAALSGAGCSIGGDDEVVGIEQQGGDSTESSHNSSQALEDVYALSKIDRAVDAYDTEELAKADELFDNMSPDAQKMFGDADKAIDSAQAESIVSDVKYSDLEPEDARKQVAEQIDDPNVAKKVNHAIDATQASDIIDDVKYWSGEPDEARDVIKEQIKDEGIKQKALTAIDRVQAEDVYTDAIYGSAEISAARKILEGLKDSEARSKALAALDAYERELSSGDYGSSYDEQSELEDMAYDASTEIDKENARSSEWLDGQGRLQDDAMTAVSGKVDDYIRQEYGLKKQENPAINIEAYNKPNEQIIVKGIKGNKVTITARDEQGNSDEVEVEQFANVVVDGENITLKFEDGAEVPDNTKQQLQSIFDTIKPLLYASFQNGDVANIRFLVGEDDFHFDPITHEIIVGFDPSEYYSMDETRSSLVHENTHGLTNGLFGPQEDYSESEAQLVDSACTSLRDAALNTLQTSLTSMPAHLTKLEALAKPEHKRIFTVLREAVEAGTLAESVEGEWAGFGDTILNECLDAGIFGQVIVDVATKEGITINEGDFDYIQEDSNFVSLANEWYDASRTYAVYAKVNESAYVTTDSSAKEYFGHSEDSTTELVASIIDVSVSYPDQFADTIANMPEDEKASTIEALGMAIDVLVKRHPELLGYFSQLEARILTAAHAA